MINPRLLICKYNTLPKRKLSKNGAGKRVMFDGGYATFSEAGVPGWHYFLCDHAGSVRVVADMGAHRADKPLLSLRVDSQAVVGASGSSPAILPSNAGALPGAPTATR